MSRLNCLFAYFISDFVFDDKLLLNKFNYDKNFILNNRFLKKKFLLNVENPYYYFLDKFS